MPFMGTIAPASEVEARLLTGSTNDAPAVFSAGIGDGHVQFGGPAHAVAPGASRAIRLSTGNAGMVIVHVELNDLSEMAELELRVNGAVRDVAQVRGEIWWSYAVEAVAPQHSAHSYGISMLHGVADSRKTPRSA